MTRDYEPATRKPWQDPIKHIVRAIDQHTALHLATGDLWHATQAQRLREYVAELKEWLTQQPPD